MRITYDSAGPFKQLQRARYILVYDRNTGTVVKTYLKTSNLTKRFGNQERLIIDVVKEEIGRMSTKYGFLNIPLDEITDVYQDDGNGTFHDDIKIYLTLYVLESYGYMQELLTNISNDLYPLYESNEFEEFTRRTELVTRKLNHDRITRKQKAKTNSLIRSLDMLTTLDEDHCKYIVNRFLAKDEFTHLSQDRILRF